MLSACLDLEIAFPLVKDLKESGACIGACLAGAASYLVSST